MAVLTYADEKNVDLRYLAAPAPLPQIFADRNLLEQVLINLVSNAIKYSPPGDWTRVAAVQQNDQIAVPVQDNGLSIPSESIPRLAYVRLDRADGVLLNRGSRDSSGRPILGVKVG